MDPELKTLLVALVEGQVKLADGQMKLAEGLARTDATVARLAERMEQGFVRLTAEMGVLAEAQRRTEERMGWFAAHLIRGSTEAAERHAPVVSS